MLYYAQRKIHFFLSIRKWGRGRRKKAVKQQVEPVSRYTAKTEYINFKTNIPRKGISGPKSQFPHSDICEWCTVYIPTIGLPILLEEICRPILGLNKSLTDTWMWKLGLRPCYSQKRNTLVGFSLQCISLWAKSGKSAVPQNILVTTVQCILYLLIIWIQWQVDLFFFQHFFIQISWTEILLYEYTVYMFLTDLPFPLWIFPVELFPACPVNTVYLKNSACFLWIIFMPQSLTIFENQRNL